MESNELLSTLVLLGSRWITKIIGAGGASVVSRVLGMLLAAIAANDVLAGIKLYFDL